MFSIVAQNVRIEFPIYDTYARSLRHQLGLGRVASNLNQALYKRSPVGGNINIGRSGRSVITALNGVSFEIDDGDRVGLIGHNGSGKTSLLRAISGIYEPVSGKLIIDGRVTPLFDMQLGMDPDSTGIENIWLRGRMLDLSADKIKETVEEVSEFSELGDYLHMPIRTYSAGMMVRLAFGVSTAIRPEILVLDEMIGAGDEAFMGRAKVRLESFIARTGILVIASHSAAMLREWCNKGMLLEHGDLVMYGPIDEVVKRYEKGS
jgi:homopolymeric O-antigen transport system ATP-binding protein